MVKMKEQARPTGKETTSITLEDGTIVMSDSDSSLEGAAKLRSGMEGGSLVSGPPMEGSQGVCKVIDQVPQCKATQDTLPSKPVTPGVVPTQKPRLSAWVDLFKDNRNPTKGRKLSRNEAMKDRVVVLEYEDVDDIKEAWGICLIGYVLGKFPEVKAIVEVCKSWKVSYKYFLHSSGWIVFKLESEEHRDMVLANGPYASYGRPWPLKEIPPFFDFNDKGLNSIPTWITLPGLPLECWKDQALEKITTQVGDPVVTDRLTAEITCLSYARVLVEVDITTPLTRVVPIQLPNGEIHAQPVLYEMELKRCTYCHKFGHNRGDCQETTKLEKNPTKIWVRKDQPDTASNPNRGESTTGADASKSKGKEIDYPEKVCTDKEKEKGTPPFGEQSGANKAVISETEATVLVRPEEGDIQREKQKRLEAIDVVLALPSAEAATKEEQLRDREPGPSIEQPSLGDMNREVQSEQEEPVPREGSKQKDLDFYGFLEDMESEEEKLGQRSTRKTKKTKKKKEKGRREAKDKGKEAMPQI